MLQNIKTEVRACARLDFTTRWPLIDIASSIL